MKNYLIILSGWAVHQFVWIPIYNLLKEDYEIIIIDWNDVTLLNGFKQKVITVLKERNICKFSILGWSLGSLVAIEIATSCSFQIDKMILISGTSRFVQNQADNYNIGWHKKILDRMIYMLKKYPEETLRKFYKNLFSKEELKNGYYNCFIEKSPFFDKKSSIESLILGLKYLRFKDLKDKISDLNMSVLLIHGDEDIICPIEASEYIKINLNKSSRLVPFIKTGHMPFYTKPNQCYEIIKNFMLDGEII
ncbi:alpha/beta fold hydrolase [Caminicella sporogenes]|uniref:alpha/beta fold hydrolase n=1 Tax=Caminicella sporogenes TaxID=166485 RepID=UPI00253F8B71|nr:alpha/beta hydrolase [Caminicella sporogenes]WIF95521.1 alpha/beta hydrolase [Caminicella sporogenes]